MLLWVLVTVVVILLIWLLARPFYWSGKGIEYLIPWPLFGNTFSVTRGNVTFGRTLYNAFPNEKLYGFHFLIKPALLVRDPDLIVDITVKNYDNFTDNALGSNQETDLVGGNLLFLKGQQWREVRTKLNPFFTPMKVKAMLAAVDVTLPKCFKVLDELIRIGEPCNQREILVQIVNDVMTQSVFGIESDVYEKDSQFKPLADIFFAPRTNLMFVIKRTSQTLFKLLRLQSTSTSGVKFIEKITRDLVEYKKTHNAKGQDFVQGMIKIMEEHKQTAENNDGKVEYYPDGTRVPKFNFEEMFLHTFIVYLGGIESTATTMTWLFYELALNQEIQERCRDEVMAIVENKNRHVTLDDLSEIPYITAAIKEAVRMYPAFTLMGRVCTKAYTFKEFDLPVEPGQLIIIPVEALQRDPKYFENPNTFNPDRFLDEESKSNMLITFGLGPKLCIGKTFAMNEMMLVVARLLQKYRFTINKKTELPLLSDKRRPVNGPQQPLWLDVSYV